MATFAFQVDRVYSVLSALTLHPNAELSGESFGVAPGDSVIYRGLVELDGVPRYAFDVEGRKGYTKDRAAIETGLQKNDDALAQLNQ